MKKKILSIIITALICLIALSGCDYSKPLKIGFEGQINGRIPAISVAVKSNRSVFDIDDVTLDFYFGHSGARFNYEDKEVQLIGLALYFCNEAGYYTTNRDTPYEDYRNIPELHFVKLISAEEFDSDEYKVDITYLRTKFNHHEKLTVPSEVFVQDDDHFGLKILYIHFNEEQNSYYISFYINSLEFKYELINSQQVRLSDLRKRF